MSTDSSNAPHVEHDFSADPTNVAPVAVPLLSLPQKTDLLVRLLADYPIGQFETPDGTRFLSIRSQGPIWGGRTESVASRCMADIYDAKLFILEPTHSRCVQDVRDTRYTFWRSRIKKVVETRRFERSIAPRAAWRVLGAFIGTANIFSHAPALAAGVGGDAFGPSGPVIRIPHVPACLDVVLTVHNEHAEMLPFHALIVGKRTPPPREDDVRLTAAEAQRLYEMIKNPGRLSMDDIELAHKLDVRTPTP